MSGPITLKDLARLPTSALSEELLFRGYSRVQVDERRCRACGCTDDRACPGGCWWVEADLCSACDEVTD